MEQQLKQRLTGAVVLVSLAVIFIPVILEGPRDEWTPRDHTIPKPPGLDYQAPADLPIPAPVPASSTQQPEEKTLTASRPEPIVVPQPVPEPAAAEPAAEVEAPPTPAPAPAPQQKASLAKGWYVQVGSFSQSDNAGRLRDRLKDAGMEAHSHSVKTDKGTSYRVLIGPSATRPQAEKVLQRLTDTQKLQGIVIEIDGSEAA